MEVPRDDGIETGRLKHHARGHGIHEHFIAFHVRNNPSLRSSRHSSQSTSPYRCALIFVTTVTFLLGRFYAVFRSEAHEPLDGMPSEDCDFGGYLPRLADVRTAALAGVFALAVFANGDPVEVAGAAAL